jgi:hypothetical protein
MTRANGKATARKRKPLRPGPGGKIASGYGAAVDRGIHQGIARCEAFGKMAGRAQARATKGSIGGKGG